jgi:deoxyribose-phosphate aldolase
MTTSGSTPITGPDQTSASMESDPIGSLMLNPAPHIEHTLLSSLATPDAILRLCEEAVEHGFAAVCIPPVYVKLAATRLFGSEVAVGTVIGFPLGYDATVTKLQAVHEAIFQGADELDLVLQQGLARAGELELVADEIRQVVNAAGGLPVKVIIECCHLDAAAKRQLTELVADAGAAYVKTSTGFATSGAELDDVHLLCQVAAGRIKIKAAGGIRDLHACQQFLQAGADRIGTSAGIQIMQQWWQLQKAGK